MFAQRENGAGDDFDDVRRFMCDVAVVRNAREVEHITASAAELKAQIYPASAK